MNLSTNHDLSNRSIEIELQFEKIIKNLIICNYSKFFEIIENLFDFFETNQITALKLNIYFLEYVKEKKYIIFNSDLFEFKIIFLYKNNYLYMYFIDKNKKNITKKFIDEILNNTPSKFYLYLYPFYIKFLKNGDYVGDLYYFLIFQKSLIW